MYAIDAEAKSRRAASQQGQVDKLFTARNLSCGTVIPTTLLRVE